MIIRLIKWLLILIVPILLVGCAMTYGDNTFTSITRLQTDTCNYRANNVLLYFEGERLDFEYEKIGLVEATAGIDASNEKVLNHLKYEAWSNCADAIINVKQSYKNRETGTLIDSKDSKMNYSSTVFSGLAVKIKTDTLRMSTDTLFIQKVRNEFAERNKKTSEQITLSILGLLAGVVLLIVYFSVK